MGSFGSRAVTYRAMHRVLPGCADTMATKWNFGHAEWQHGVSDTTTDCHDSYKLLSTARRSTHPQVRSFRLIMSAVTKLAPTFASPPTPAACPAPPVGCDEGEALADALPVLMLAVPELVIVPVDVAFPTRPTPYALVEAPSSAHVSPPITCCWKVAFCHAAGISQPVRAGAVRARRTGVEMPERGVERPTGLGRARLQRLGGLWRLDVPGDGMRCPF